MDTKATVCFIQLVCSLVFILPVKSDLTGKRLRILERKFDTYVYEMSLLLQHTEIIDDRLSKLENANTSKSDNEHNLIREEDTHTAETNKGDNDHVYQAMFKAFKAEKMQRIKLEVRYEQLEKTVIQLQESCSEGMKMEGKPNLPAKSPHALNELLILKQVRENKIEIGNVEEKTNAKFDNLLAVTEEIRKTQENLNQKIASVEDLITDNSDDFNKKLEEYQKKSVVPTNLPHLFNKTKISFSARVSLSIRNLKPDTTLRFSDVVTNEGSAYSKSTGIFTAPVDGTYVFFVHILGPDRALEMRLNKNNYGIMWLYSNGNVLGPDGNMVVLQLIKGDKIYVVKNGPHGEPPFYVHHLWSTFSGFMI